MYREYLQKLNHDKSVSKTEFRSIDSKSLGSDQNQQQEATISQNDSNNLTIPDRSDEDADWELCELCDKPVPPSQASEYRGGTYCSKCVMVALKDLE
jgi:RNA polymerase-binding transcription factor DksA